MTEAQMFANADSKIANQIGNLVIQNTRFMTAIEQLQRDKSMLSAENKRLTERIAELEKKIADSSNGSAVVQPVLDAVAPSSSAPSNSGDHNTVAPGDSKANTAATADSKEPAASPAESEK